MNPNPNTRTNQIIPAVDWYAFYLLQTDPYYSLVRLVCWQLEEDLQSGSHAIVGMVASAIGGTVGRAPDAEGFHMYVHDDDVRQGTLRPIIGRQKEIYEAK
jgi:hypothetical protein